MPNIKLSKIILNLYQSKYKKFFTLLRIVVTILLFYIIFKGINISDTIKIIASSNIFYLVLAIFLSLCFHLLTVYKWKFSLIQNKVHIKYLKLLKFQFISVFVQNFLPSSIGGDLTKGFLAFKGNPKIRVASSILICRISGLLALIILANLTLLILASKNYAIQQLKWIAFTFLLLTILIYIMLFNLKIQDWFIKLYNSIKIKKLKLFEIDIFFEKINSYRDKKNMLYLLGLSLLIQLFPILTAYSIFLAVDASISILYFFIYVPIITFISMIPISINGLGIREGLFFYFFKRFVDSNDTILAFIVLVLVIQIFFSLIGGLLVLLKQKN